MKRSLEEALFYRFNFFHPNTPITQSLMAFGCEHDDGWFDILWELCKALEVEIKKIEEKRTKKEKTIELIKDGDNDWFKVQQVKEKFGSLRFYVTMASDEMYKLISDAEKKSQETCEVCGDKASLMEKSSWYKTLCKDCGNKNGYESIKNTEQ
jgi:hypothetical protein